MEEGVTFSLAALGRAGTFTVEILSHSDGGWLLEIESPSWCFTFRLVGSSTVNDMAEFISSHVGRAEFAEIIVGSLGGATVHLVKDDEFEDRLFLRAAEGGSLVEFTLLGSNAKDFGDAVADAAADFEG